MTQRDVRAREKDPLAQSLGWFSLGLGAAQVAAPRLMCKAIGARGEGRAPALMRLMGARELTQGVGILSRPRPTAWLWSRVAGDAIDLALLGLTAAKGPGRKRAAFAIANVIAVTVPDVYESRFLARKRGEPQSGQRIRKAVTINRGRQDVEAAWAAAIELRAKVDGANASVSFSDAPGGRGTELAVDFVQDPPLGDLGAMATKLTGNDLATELSDHLRRFKQQVETGEIVRSEGAPQGHLLVAHLKQRPAQPLEEVPA